MSSGTGLPPLEHASFAVSSRLISCLVTEQLIRALYIPTPRSKIITGVMVALSPAASTDPTRGFESISADEVIAVVPMLNTPIFLADGVSIGLLDPLDMAPRIYDLVRDKPDKSHIDPCTTQVQSLVHRFIARSSGCSLRPVSDPVQLWNRFADGVDLPHEMKTVIAKELLSSLHYQNLAYRNPPRCPSIDSDPIKWEQSLVAGHPTHPMHRARLLPFTDNGYDWYRPSIRFVEVPKADMVLCGSFDSTSISLVTKALNGSNWEVDHGRYFYVPVHELQAPNISKMFPGVKILPPDICLKALAQSSIRTVIVDELPGYALKLSVGVKISSSLRTISHFTANFGPRFTAEVVPKLTVDHSIFAVETEPSSAIYRCEDPDIQKHFTVVVRKQYEPSPTENVLVIAALLETDHANTPPGVPAVSHIFGLDTESKRIDFLDRYIELSCKALLPALVYNGVAFEAHAQNMLLRVERATGRLTGFVFRDLGGLRIHPPTLRKSTGVDFEFLPEHCVATETLQEIYPKFYHTYVHNHVQRLIRLLDLHRNGVGWELLRRHMDAVIPAGHELKTLWLSPESKTVESKSLMRMRLQDVYRENVYHPFPNMIQYRPDRLDSRREFML